VEHGLGYLPFTEKQVTTPTGLSKEEEISFYSLNQPASISVIYVLAYYEILTLLECGFKVQREC
jgi:hypothetical protein